MKLFVLVLVVILVSGLVACNSDTQPETAATTTYNYIYIPNETSSLSQESQTCEVESETQTQLPEESSVQETTTQTPETTTRVTETTTQIPETTTQVPETTTRIPETTAVESTVIQESTTQNTQPTTSEPIGSDVTLNVSVPDANGTMEVDLSEDNKYTQIVVSQRDIDASLLVAVYSVPESGQNYVFEFSSAGAENRTAENIRRVYLIDSSGEITYVSAAYSSEAENVSVMENWFNMNVLIKGMIFPAIEERLK